MESLNKFMSETVGPAATREVVTSPLSALEDGLMKRAFHDICTDESWLAQFEGTPLAPQAVALAEQELAVAQRQLQERMARAAQQTPNWEQECAERDGIRLQKQQLAIELYKMKAMTPAPKPGDAVIGQPEIPNAASLGGGASAGAAGGAPVEEVTAPKVAQASKIGALLDQAAQAGWSHRVPMIKNFARTVSATGKVSSVMEDKPQYLAALPFGAPYVGYQRGKATGRGMEGAVQGYLGAVGGGGVGSVLGGGAGALLGGGAGLALKAMGKNVDPAQLATMGSMVGTIPGALVGGAHGTNAMTRHLLPAEKAAAISKLAKQLLASKAT